MIRSIGLIDVISLLQGFLWTLGVASLGFMFGAIVGIVVAMARLSGFGPVRWAASLYVQVVQGTPLLSHLFLFYFGLSLLGVEVPPIVAASLALTFYVGAFLGEIWRGSVQSVPRGQWEAGASMGLSWFNLTRLVILPQAMRLAMGPTVNFVVQLVKNSSLVSTVGVVELTRVGQIISGATFQPLLVFSIVACFYFVICYPLTVIGRRMSDKYEAERR